MKRFKKVFMALAFIFAGVLAFSLASNTKVHAAGTTVTYTVTSTSAVTVGGTAPTGASATYSSTYTSKCQLTAGNSMTLTLSGFEGNKITGITLSMRSNKSSGSGSLSVTAGSTTIASIADAAFNSASWNGAYSQDYVPITVSMSDSDYVIQKDETVSIILAASVKSLYCESFSITYQSGVDVELEDITLNKASLEMEIGDEETLVATLSPSGTTYTDYTWVTGDDKVATVDETGKVTAVGTGTTIISAVSDHNNTIKGECTVTVSAPAHPEYNEFKEIDLQEQLAFHYSYEKQYELVTTPVEGKNYYFGYANDNEALFANASISSTIGLVNSVSNAGTYQVVASEGNYLIIANNKYLTLNDKNNIAAVPIEGATITDYYRWSFDTNTGRFINVNTTSRYLGINDAKTGIKAYATSGSYTPAVFYNTDGEVSFKDAANNENKVTMRIGYTISKTLYESLEALGTTVTFGVRLNDTTNVECTKVVVDEDTYKLFVAVNNIPLDKIDTVITACGYVSVDGTDTYTTEVNTYSVKTLAQEYLTNHADNEAVVTAKYALVYLAYYA